MCSGDVFEDMSRYIGNLYGVGVGQSDIRTCRDSVNDELSILEAVIGAIHASDFTSKVVSIRHHNVMHIKILAVMNRHVVSDGLTRFGDLLVSHLMNGDRARFNDRHINRIRRNRNMLAILIVFNICRVSQERFIFFTHRVGVGDIDGLPCSNLSNSPATVAIIDVSIAICCINRTSKVVVIGDN